MEIKSVAITGVSGYIGSWICQKALDAGLHVVGTVRDLNTDHKTEHLKALSGTERLTILRADLLDPIALLSAFQDLDAVIHCASPHIQTKISDPIQQLLRPAVEGTKNVLQAVNGVPSIKRVVLTSSLLAAVADATEAREYPRWRVTEHHWNHTSTLTYDPYGYSKTEAERIAWTTAHAQTRWDLITINPALVVGRSLSTRTDFTSARIIRSFGDGTFARGVPSLHLELIDVRDVADTHIKALLTPSAGGRYLLTERALSLKMIASHLREHFGTHYPFPKRTLPKWLASLLAPRLGITRHYLRRHIDSSFEIDTTRARTELLPNLRDTRESIIDHFRQITENDTLPALILHK